jgi:spore protease
LQIRTDLAMEAIGPEGARGKTNIPGVRVSIWDESGITITEVIIDEDVGVRMLGKPKGRYITLECGQVKAGDPEIRRAVSSLLAEELSRMLPEGDGPVMVVGLGNRMVTPDSLGPMTVDHTLVTRHIFQELPDSVDDRMKPVCAIAPGVLGVTGIETLEMVSALAERVKPRAVIAIDALAAREVSRVGTAIQLTDTGIQPGSGVGNHRRALNRDAVGVPVIAVGVPTVIYASTIVRDALGKLGGEEEDLDKLTEDMLRNATGDMIVTPREVDDLVEDVAGMVALGINQALHPGLSDAEIATMMP